MPPANSRVATPPVDAVAPPLTPSSYISALSEALESPAAQDVYNLAATLTTPSDSRLRQLRTAQDDHLRLERSRERLRTLEREQERGDLEHRSRNERLEIISRLGRMPPSDTRTAYSDRVPSQNHLYDWSPAAPNEVDDEELELILAELRREQPHLRPEVLRALGRSQLDAERERAWIAGNRSLNGTAAQSGDSSLRQTAMLQAVRRQRNREHRQRYSADRDPSRPYAGNWVPRVGQTESMIQAAAMQRIAERRTSLEQAREQMRHRDAAERVDSYRRHYLERPTTPTSSPTMLEQTIKYLSRIRSSTSLDDTLTLAIDAGFMAKDFFCHDREDFILDTCNISPPAETSWLAPGAVLSGCQHATTVTSTVVVPNAQPNPFRIPPQTFFNPADRAWRNHNRYQAARRAQIALTQAPPEVVTSHAPQQDRWPVKVTVHSVDYERMTLTATMEAYNVPSHPHQLQSVLNGADRTPQTSSQRNSSSITTYLEGEILDFNIHTLLTESFRSDVSNDATYWRKLPPFRNFTDDEIIRNLSSQHWLRDVLCKEFILMRWKERCFVKPLPRQSTPPPATTLMSNSSSSLFVSSRSTAPTSSAHADSHLAIDANGHLLESATHYWGVNGSDAEHSSFDDSGCGLTISGFYYVCLERSTGKLEGLYYDPQSSPYQCLKLESLRRGVFPAWEFR